MLSTAKLLLEQLNAFGYLDTFNAERSNPPREEIPNLATRLIVVSLLETPINIAINLRKPGL